jgi:MFS transporter, DHA1 family, tetracycline resistance protein
LLAKKHLEFFSKNQSFGFFMHHSIQKIALLSALLVAFLDMMGVGLVYPMFSSMLYHDKIQLLGPDASETAKGVWLGILLCAMPIAQFFSSPILGALSDQKGRKPVLKYTLLICALGYLVSAWGVYQQSLFLLIAGRVIVGIGTGTFSVVSAVLADISTPQEKAKNYGLLNMAFGVGFMIGPFLGGMLSDSTFWKWGSYDKPFLFACVSSLLNLILLLAYFKETHLKPKSGPINWILGIRNLKKAVKMPSMRSLFGSVFLFVIGWSFYWEFIPVTWIKGYHLTAPEVGFLYAFGAAIYALSCGLLIRPIVSRFPAPKVLFYSLALSGLYIYLMLFPMSLSIFWFYIPLQQFLIALIFPTASTTVSNLADADSQGETLGILQSIISVGFAISPLLSGVFVGLSTRAPILVGGTALLLAALVMLLGNREMLFRKKA